MKKKLKAAFYTFLVLLVIGLLVICGRIYPHETGLTIVILFTCFLVFFLYCVILNFID
jgi:hypothetical protein